MTIVTHHGDGTCSALATGEACLHVLGDVSTQRLSHIWPAGKWRRRFFCLLRTRFGDRGRIANWTRSWHGPWEVRFAWDPETVVFIGDTRTECLAWELEYFTLNPP